MIRTAIGVDPGYATFGIACLTRGSEQRWSAPYVRLVTTPPSMPFHERLHVIYKALYEVPPEIFHVRKSETVIACESQTGTQEGKRRKGLTNVEALLVQQVVGMVRAYAYLYGTHFIEPTPAQVKKVLMGIKQTATKAQVQRAVRAIVNGLPDDMSEHESDAVGTALAGARMAGVRGKGST